MVHLGLKMRIEENFSGLKRWTLYKILLKTFQKFHIRISRPSRFMELDLPRGKFL